MRNVIGPVGVSAHVIVAVPANGADPVAVFEAVSDQLSVRARSSELGRRTMAAQ